MEKTNRNQTNRKESGNKQTKRKRKPKPKRIRRFLLAMFLTIAAGLFCAMAAYIFIIISGDRYLDENEGSIVFKETTIIYDKDGNEASRLFVENREYVNSGDMPELLKQAFIATEDKRFNEHEGIDYIGIGRAIVKDIIARKAVEGASTITQQLARNLFLTNEKTFFRKATELSIATALESRYSKDKILEMYLNRIFFGKGSYGIQAAATTYFGKDNLHDLELDEIAVLAAIPKAPSYYNPIDNPERSKQRRDTVLLLMAQQGLITEAEKLAAQSKPVEANAYNTKINYPSYIDYVMKEVQEFTSISEEELHNDGYHIYTSLNADAQKALEAAYEDPANFPKDGPNQIVQSSMVILDNQSGGISAMIGGREYARKGLNRAIQKRQPGSAFKPIVSFAPAIESGDWNIYSMLSNEKQSFNGYEPRNLGGTYSDKVSMLEAVRKSINIPAVWLLNQIGVKKGLDFAATLGIEMAEEDRNLAIALGGLTNGASPLEMARAYSAFAANGTLHTTHAITSITNKAGKVVYSWDDKANSKQVMSEEAAWYTTMLLKDVVAQGTGTKAKIKNHEVAGKTGTTQSGLKGVNGNRDIWFVGYTNAYTAAVWMGFDKTDAKHILSDYSGIASTLFSTVMSKAQPTEKSSLTKPKGVEPPKQTVAPVTDLAASYSDERVQIELNWSKLDGNYEYRLYRKTADEIDYAQLISTDKVSVADMLIMPGTTYQYYVTVYDPKLDAESERSNIVEAIVAAELEEPPLDEEPGIEDGESELEPQTPSEPGEPAEPGDPTVPSEPNTPGSPSENENGELPLPGVDLELPQLPDRESQSGNPG
jgi:penicillin-binding protein 2A